MPTRADILRPVGVAQGVLVVDDHVALAENITEILDLGGYVTAVAETAIRSVVVPQKTRGALGPGSSPQRCPHGTVSAANPADAPTEPPPTS